jgi:hypothetical protein
MDLGLSVHYPNVYISRGEQGVRGLRSDEGRQSLNNPRLFPPLPDLYFEMDNKDIKDPNAFDDVHVGKPEYADYGDAAAQVETYSGEYVDAGHTALKRGLKPRE